MRDRGARDLDDLCRLALRGDGRALQELSARFDAAEQMAPGLCDVIEQAVLDAVPPDTYRALLELQVEVALATRRLDLLQPMIDLGLADRYEAYAAAIDELLGRDTLLRMAEVLGDLARDGDAQAGRELVRLRRHLEL